MELAVGVMALGAYRLEHVLAMRLDVACELLAAAGRIGERRAAAAAEAVSRARGGGATVGGPELLTGLLRHGR